MVDGIADDVGQRIAHHLDHFAIEFDLAAFEIDHDLLAEIVRQVAHKARQRRKEMLEPLHPHPRDRIADIGKDCREAFEGAVDGRLLARFAKAARQIVAGQHHVGNALHYRIEQVDRQADRTLDALARGGFLGVVRASICFAHSFAGFEVVRFDIALDLDLAIGLERRDQRIVIAVGQFFPGLDGVGHFGNAVDDGQYSSHQIAVWLAASGAAFGQRIFCRMTEFFETREVEEAAIALHRVDEAKDRIDARLVRRVGFPRDQFAAALLQHFARFGDEFRQQFFHLDDPVFLRGPLMAQDG